MHNAHTGTLSCNMGHVNAKEIHRAGVWGLDGIGAAQGMGAFSVRPARGRAVFLGVRERPASRVLDPPAGSLGLRRD